MPSTQHRVFQIAGLLLWLGILGGALAWWVNRDPKSYFAISPETTEIVGPLDADGFVDYPRALNERRQKEVEGKTNGAGYLWHAVLSDEDISPSILSEWGVDFTSMKHPAKSLLSGYSKIAPQATGMAGFGGPPMNDAQFEDVWKSEDHPQIAQFLTDHQESLALIEQASRAECIFLPRLSTARHEPWSQSDYQLSQSIQQASEILAIRAMGRAGDGDLDGALKDCTTLRRLASLLAEDDRGSFSHFFTRIMFKRAMKAERTIAYRQGPESKETLKAYFDQVAPAELPIDYDRLGLQMRWKLYDHFQYLSTLNRDELRKLNAANGRGSGRGNREPEIPTGVDWGQVMKRTRIVFEKEIEEAKKNHGLSFQVQRDSNPITNPMEDKNSRSMGLWTTAGRSEYAAKIFQVEAHAMQLRGLDCEIRAEKDLTKITLALIYYRMEHGIYPEDLKSLVPVYLDSIPNDLYAAGTPYNYESLEDGKKFRLRSVYVDQKINLEDEFSDIVAVPE